MEKQTQIWIIKQKLTKKLTKKYPLHELMHCQLWWEAKGRWKRRQMVWIEASSNGANWKFGELKRRDQCQWRAEASPSMPTATLKRHHRRRSPMATLKHHDQHKSPTATLKRCHWCQRQAEASPLVPMATLKRRNRCWSPMATIKRRDRPWLPTVMLKHRDQRQWRCLSVATGPMAAQQAWWAATVEVRWSSCEVLSEGKRELGKGRKIKWEKWKKKGVEVF